MTQEFTISRTIEFDAGHRVPSHEGQCRNPHGHRYKVVIEVTGALADEGAEEGMVLDFGSLKYILRTYVHDILDHGFIVYDKDEVLAGVLQHGSENDPAGGWKVVTFPYVPTAENIAAWVAEQIKDHIWSWSQGRAWLHRVHVQETPHSVATVEL